MRRKILCLLAALACLPAWPQEIPELNEIVVTATRVDSGVLESPSAITVISPKEIADSGARDVAGVINGQPGVVVNDYGAAGSLKTVSIRGSASNQVLVLLDGIRLNSSRDGGIDLSTIPMEIIDHIEIVRGGESALYGSSAIGGVINIITKKAQKAALNLSITNGSYLPHEASILSPSLTTSPTAANPLDLVDSQKVDLSFAGKLGNVGLSAGGSFFRAVNAFTWNDTAVINGWRRMTNADSLSGNGYVGVDAPLLGGKLSVKGIFDASDTGAPYKVDFPNATARQTNAAASGSLAWKTERFFTDALTLDLKGFYRYDELGYDDPTNPPASLHRTHTASVDVTQKFIIANPVSAIYGGSASFDHVDSTNYASPKERLNVAGFLSLPISPTDSLTVTPSIRYDFYSDFAGNLSYSLTAVFLLSEQSSLRASFGSAYRVPTLNELYWYGPYPAFPPFSTYGNPNLKPETSYNGEMGLSFEGKRVALETSVFVRMLFDQIPAAWPYDPALPGYTPVNISQSLLPGAEIHCKVRVTNRISFDASYTFIDSFVLQYAGTSYGLNDNVRVTYVPLHSLEIKARYEDEVNSLGLETQYVSEKFTYIPNTAASAIPGYFVANADYRFKAIQNIEFFLALKNIFNALYYTQAGYPMPPFSIETGVSLHL